MNSDELEGRISNVMRRWTAGRMATTMVGKGWTKGQPAHSIVPLLMVLILARIPLDWSSWWRQEEFGGISLQSFVRIPGAALLGILAALWLVNGWLSDRWIERHPASRLATPWRRGLRFFAAGIPLLSFYVMTMSTRGGAARTARLDLTDPGRAPRAFRASRGLEASVATVGWLVGSNGLFLFLAAAWFAAPREEAAGHLWRLWTAALVAAGASAAVMKVCQGLWPLRSWAGGLARWLPAAWLLPMPAPLVAWIATARLNLSFRDLDDRGTLVGGVFGRRTGISRITAWNGHRDFLVRQRDARRWHWAWQRSDDYDSAATECLVSLYRLKCYVLAVDGVLLGRALVWLSARGRGPALPAIERALAWYGQAFLLLASAGFLVALIIGVGLQSGRGGRSLWPDVGAYLGLTHMTLFFGLITGSFLEKGDLQWLGRTLLDLCSSGAVLVLLWTVVNPLWRRLWPGAPGRRDLLLWSALLFALGFLGMGLLLEAQYGANISGTFRIVSLLSPLWNLALALLFLKDFLRPFGLREALRLRPRWRMAFLLLTLAAPLGGLAIPLWIWARHRWWPEWERSWSPGAALPGRIALTPSGGGR